MKKQIGSGWDDGQDKYVVCPVCKTKRYSREKMKALLNGRKLRLRKPFRCSMEGTRHYIVVIVVENVLGLRPATDDESRQINHEEQTESGLRRPTASARHARAMHQQGRRPSSGKLEAVTDSDSGGDETVNTATGMTAQEEKILSQKLAKVKAQIAEQVVIANRFKLLREHARGGRALVIEGRDLETCRPVAIKFYASTLLDVGPECELDRERIKRCFFIERAISSIHSVTAVATLTNETFGSLIIEEFIDGETLDSLIENGRSLPEEEVIEIGLAVLAVLKQTHALGIVHRDIKPGNIMRIRRDGMPDRIILIDWDIAKAAGDRKDNLALHGTEFNPEEEDTLHRDLTSDGIIIGTPNYIAPEQLDGGRIGPATDIYQLGATLYHLITGRLVFAWATKSEMERLVLYERPSPAYAVTNNASRWLSKILAKALEKNPPDRFRSADEFEQALLSRKSGKSGKGWLSWLFGS